MSPLIRKRVSACRRRLNWINMIEKASASLLASLIAGAVFMLLTRIEELGLAAQAWPGVGLLIVLAMLSSLCWAHFTRQRDFGAAVAIDQRLNLKERVSTALCYPAPTRPIELAVIEDAETVARAIKPSKHFPLPHQRSFYWCLLPLVVIGALSLLEPLSLFGKQPPPPPKRPKVVLTEMETKAIEKLEEAMKEVIDDEKLTENSEINKLKADLDKTLKELKAGKMTRPQVIGELSSMQDRMSERRKMLGKKLRPKTPGDLTANFKFTNPISDRLDKGKFADAANQMNELKKQVEKQMQSGEMSEEDREQLAKELNALAKMVGANSELGQTLQAAAQAAASNNAGELSEQLNQAAMDMQDMQALMSEMAMLNAMESLLNEQKMGMSSRAGGKPGEGDPGNPGNSGQPGNSAQGRSGDGSMPGQGNRGQAGQNGQGGAGGQGQGAGRGSGDSDAGRERGFQEGGRGLAQGRGPGMGGPGQGRGGQAQFSDQQTTFKREQLNQQLDKGKILSILKVDGPQQKGEATVEFLQVVQQYSQEAEDALDREHIPLHMQKLVRNWLDTLRQGNQQTKEKKDEK